MRWLDGITDSMDVNFEHTPGERGQGSLACYSCKELDTIEQLNNNI